MDQRVSAAWEAVRGKGARYATYYAYYDGLRLPTYTNSRLKQVFKDFDANFQANWCSVVVNAVLARLAVTGADIPGATNTPEAELSAMWDRTQLTNEQRMVHEAALVCGEGVLIVGQEEQGAVAYANIPSLVHVAYSGDRPHDVAWACKFWEDADKQARATVYDDTMVVYYAAPGKLEDLGTGGAFREERREAHGFGETPVFHFLPSRRRVLSDLQSILPLQNAINKLLADMMVAAEFGAFKQRYVIAKAAGNQASQLKNLPNEIWSIGDPDAKVGELSAAELTNYIGAIENLIAQVGSISMTPRHFFMQSGATQASGEALIAQEAPLNSKVEDRQAAFGPTWRRALRLMARVDGIEGADALQVTWRPAETLQPLTAANVVMTLTNAGVPLTEALRSVGSTQAEIAAVEEAQAAEAARRRETLEVLTMQAQADAMTGGGVDRG